MGATLEGKNLVFPLRAVPSEKGGKYSIVRVISLGMYPSNVSSKGVFQYIMNVKIHSILDSTVSLWT